MQYREFLPGPGTADWVARYWTMSVSGVEPGFGHRIIPDGCTDVVVAVRRPAPTIVAVRGPRATPLVLPVSPGDRYFGMRLWPDAGALVLGAPAGSLVELMAPAGGFVGGDADRLGRAFDPAPEAAAAPGIFGNWLEPRLGLLPPLDPAVRLTILAASAADGAARVTDLAKIVGLGPRQLQRRFLRSTGLTIKTYARIRRLRATLGHLLAREPRTWSQVAAALGFADHSHLAGEFARLAGAPPTEIAAYIARIQHLDVVP